MVVPPNESRSPRPAISHRIPHAVTHPSHSAVGSSLPAAVGNVIRVVDVAGEPQALNVNALIHQSGRQHARRFRQSRQTDLPNRRSHAEIHPVFSDWNLNSPNDRIVIL